MKKCIFINPYFGKLPKSFPIFLKTCEKNPLFEWIFFTDDETIYDWPANVKKIKMTFSELQDLVKAKFDFEIILDKPYKLCDYKPAYGYLFEEYIQGYEFWGHCDVDTIMGNLNAFLTDELLNSYDKLFCLGHMILYRNSYDNNRTFMLSVNGESYFKESFTSSSITKFDETFGGKKNINTIFVENGKRVFMEDWSENFKLLPTRFIKTTFNHSKYKFDIEPYRDVLYVWDDGNITKYFLNNDKLIEEKVMYMHFQERDMKYTEDVIPAEKFYIVPNRFIKCKYRKIDKDIFLKINKNPFSMHFFEFKYHRLKKRLKNR